MGVDPKENVPQVQPWYVDPAGALNRHQQEKARQMKEYADKVAAQVALERKKAAEAAAKALEHAVMSFDMRKPAYALSDGLPANAQLWTAVMTYSFPIERRAKMLEVILNRVPTWAETKVQTVKVRDALVADPRLFDELSKSTDRTQNGLKLYPATEALRTATRDFTGFFGERRENVDAQRYFQQEVAKWPAETRGRMVYHLENEAAETQYGEDRQKIIRDMLAGQYGKMTDDEKRTFNEGYKKARDATNLPKDLGK